MVTTTGPGGVKTKEVVRKYGWRCDLCVGGSVKLRRTSISAFLKTSAGMTAGGTDAIKSGQVISDDSVGQFSNNDQTVPHTHLPGDRFGD